MKRFAKQSLFLVVLALLCCGAQAADESSPRQVDCAKAKNPERCRVMQQANRACREKSGAERRQCMRENMSQTDCSKSKNPEQCEVRRKAREACKGKTGQELRECMADQLRGT